MSHKPLRHPATGLAAAIVLGLLAAFFAWQGAEPLWLALGRGTDGTATVTRCAVDADMGGRADGRMTAGPTYRCIAFEAANGAFHVTDVTLRGAGSATRTEGTSVPARMLAADREQAYATTVRALHLRWVLGLLLVLACGAGIAWATGAARLAGTRVRRRAVLLSFAGPVLLAAGFLAAAF